MADKFFFTVNPTTNIQLQKFSYLSDFDLEEILKKVHQYYQNSSKHKSLLNRQEQLLLLADKLLFYSEDLAKLITSEMGKPLQEAQLEIKKSADTAKYFSENLPRLCMAQEVKAHYQESFLLKESLGPIFAIMPWNYPVWQVIRVLVPAIGIGNPVVLKGANLTAGTSAFLQKICDEIEVGLLTSVCIDHSQAEKVISSPLIKGVTLTGSEKAGRIVSSLAGQALKKSILELGGNDAYIVFPDADLGLAAKVCTQARLVNNGQSCVAAKRFFIPHDLAQRFLDLLKIEFAKYNCGDPQFIKTNLGPLASSEFVEKSILQCQELEKAGAKKIYHDRLGSLALELQKGAFFGSRIYLVENDRSAFHEMEIFAPVALVFTYHNQEQLIEMVNQSAFGLGAALFGKDIDKLKLLAKNFDVGMIAINDQVKSDARMPFGGIKNSGFGKELGEIGFIEFCNIKTVGISRQA